AACSSLDLCFTIGVISRPGGSGCFCLCLGTRPPGFGFRRMARYGKSQPHPCPARAGPDIRSVIELDPAAMVFQDAADDREAKPGALFARRHVRLEQTRPAYLRQADTVVDHVDH